MVIDCYNHFSVEYIQQLDETLSESMDFRCRVKRLYFLKSKEIIHDHNKTSNMLPNHRLRTFEFQYNSRESIR